MPTRRNSCCDEGKVNIANRCPGCDKDAVSIETVKAMVNFPLWDIKPDDDFFYDNDVDSEIVYFSTESGMIIDEKNIRVKVFDKHQDDDDCYVCYCFKVKVGDLRSATMEERQEIFERIKTASGRGQCSCKTSNPKGSCCVGDVKQLIKQFNDADFVNKAAI
ncbi:MAG: hypothetical protein L3J71_14045 [Victivallaceae bacterium]|nr:hypothetical protein [Victivallaceae bacterium]